MNKSFTLFCSLLISSVCTYGQFSLIGSQLDGNAPNDNFGWDVDLDDRGQILVVGAPLYDNDFGQVRVYKESGGVWTQLGQDLNGDEIGQQYGFSVSLSANGKRMALGGISGTPSTRGGHVRIYDMMGGQWVQIGNTILAEVDGDQFGTDIDLNAAGNRIVVGARRNDGNGTESGQVRVYELQSGDWVQLGSDIDGENAGDEFGITVSISADGSIIAAGSVNNPDAGAGAGHVRVFQLQSGSWVQLGADIDGQNAGESLGLSVSLSDDGEALATTAPLHNHGSGFGSVRVYEWTNNAWTQIGSDIRGTSSSEGFGETVSINGDGTVIAIGTKSADENALSSGRANVFQFDNGIWTEQYSPILGQAQFDNLGKSIAINQEGNRFGIGANLAGGTQGYAVVYEDSQMPVSIGGQLAPRSLAIVSHPSAIQIRMELDNQIHPVSLTVYSMTGQVQFAGSYAHANEINLSHSWAPGIYLVRIQQGNVGLVRKVTVQ